MAYKLIVTQQAEELIDRFIYYLLIQLGNEQAALHLLKEIENIYSRLEENPFQFPVCMDDYLAQKECREAIISKMNYIVIYIVINKIVYILGIFHQLENYQEKYFKFF